MKKTKNVWLQHAASFRFCKWQFGSSISAFSVAPISAHPFFWERQGERFQIYIYSLLNCGCCFVLIVK